MLNQKFGDKPLCQNGTSMNNTEYKEYKFNNNNSTNSE